MNKKQEFIEYVKSLMDAASKSKIEPVEMTENARLYWEAFCGVGEEEKPLLTDNGKMIVTYLKEHPEFPMLKAKDIAEGLFITSHTVSGAMRKLVTDNFVEKVGQDPVLYSLTEKGKNIIID